MLRDFARKLYTGTASTPDTSTSRGALSDVQLHLDQPIYGEVEGQPVTIIGQGNMVGFSPVSFCIDSLGENAWLPTSSILITDPRFAPVTVGQGTTRSNTARSRK